VFIILSEASQRAEDLAPRSARNLHSSSAGRAEDRARSFASLRMTAALQTNFAGHHAALLFLSGLLRILKTLGEIRLK